MLHSVIRPSTDRARATGPANSTAWPRAMSDPQRPMTNRMTSLAVTSGASVPSSVMRICFGVFHASVCVASTCTTSVVPVARPSAPIPPTVQAWLSGQATVLPGSAIASSGEMTCTMPCRRLSVPSRVMPSSAAPARVRAKKGALSPMVASVRPAEVATMWSVTATVRSGRRTVRPDLRSFAKACGACRSWMTCRST